MSDPIIVPTNQNSTEAPDSLIVEPASPAPAPAVPSSSESDKPDTFPRDYVEELRRENAKWRTEAQEARQYADLFEGFEPEQATAVRNLIEMAKSGDPDARLQVAELFELEAPDSQPQYLTREDFEREWDERMSVREQEDAVSAVYDRAKGLGYKEDSEDMVRFLWHVNQAIDAEADDPYTTAHEAIQGERQKIIDEFVKGKQETANNAPTLPPANGSSPSTRQPPRTPKEARDAALARFAADRG